MGTKIRVGFGYDVHALVPDRELWLGGIKIEHTLGLLGHSDADVLIHAICDALLGAANMRDIGYHFPDTAGEYKNIDSKILLRDTMRLLREAGYELGNIDATVAAERPKLNPHIPLMKTLLNIATGSNEQYKKLYRKEKDYIAVSMVVVLQAYQGQGFMKKVLELPFAEAAKRGCPCILDTDNIQKVVKYEHCGMTKTAEKKMAHDITLYTMAYLPTSA